MNWNDIANWIYEAFQEIWQFFTDLPKHILDGLLSAIATLFEAIPPPEFLSTYSLANYLHEDISWFLIQSAFPQSLAIIGGAVTFRFLRRILTLGIW